MQKKVRNKREGQQPQAVALRRNLTSYVPISKFEVVPHDGYFNGDQAINYRYQQYLGVVIELKSDAAATQSYSVKLTLWNASVLTQTVEVLKDQRFSTVAEFLLPNPYQNQVGHVMTTQPPITGEPTTVYKHLSFKP